MLVQAWNDPGKATTLEELQDKITLVSSSLQNWGWARLAVFARRFIVCALT